MKRSIICRWILILILVFPYMSDAQTSVSTNLAGWATTTINAGVEHALSRNYSVVADGMINPWNFSGDRHVHLWMARIEGRRWLCQAMNGHFLGVHILGGQYNIKNVDMPLGMLAKTERGRHYEGQMYGAGLVYGYQWPLSRHWNVEAALGLGYVYSPYKLYGRCNRVLKSAHRNYAGPTRLSLSIAYVF